MRLAVGLMLAVMQDLVVSRPLRLLGRLGRAAAGIGSAARGVSVPRPSFGGIVSLPRLDLAPRQVVLVQREGLAGRVLGRVGLTLFLVGVGAGIVLVGK